MAALLAAPLCGSAHKFCGDDCFSIRCSGEGSKGWYMETGGLGFGLDGAVNQPEGTGLQMGKSFEVVWLKALNASYRFGNQSVSFGIGFDWRNFKMTGAPFRMKKGEFGGLELAEYPAGTTPLNSTLKIFSLAVPVLYNISVPKAHMKFSVGPVLDFNTYSSLKTNYLNGEGNRTTEYVSKLGQRPVSVDIFAAASWRCAGLYLKYAPLKAMRDFSEINFNPLTVGIIFFM